MNKKKVIEILENKYGWEGLGKSNILLDDTIEATKEAFSLNIVSQQRELLEGFVDWFNANDKTQAILSERIEEYLKTLKPFVCELKEFGRQDKPCDKQCSSCKWFEHNAN